MKIDKNDKIILNSQTIPRCSNCCKEQLCYFVLNTNFNYNEIKGNRNE